MASEPNDLVDLTNQYRGIPSYTVDAATGSTWLAGTYRVILAEAIFNPGQTTSGYRNVINLNLTPFAARGLIDYLKSLPGVMDDE